MILSEFVNVLLGVTPSVYQDEANQEPDEYIVWTMVSDKTLRADNMETECALRINVRIFTKSGNSELPAKLKAALMKNDIAYEDFEYEYITDLKYGIYSTFCEVD